MSNNSNEIRSSANVMKSKVKDKSPAPIQITAEQLIREAKERELEVIAPPSNNKILDQTDLDDFRMRKRKEFEDNLRKSATNVSYWTKYATWEEIQGDLDRARSIWERALDMDSQNMTFWIRYVELELKHGQMNHARNIFDRCVTLMPLASSQMWYKYVHMEESLKQYALCRHIFQRWIQWNPDKQVWQSFINFELRCNEKHNAREIYRRFILNNGIDKSQNWMDYAKFELRHFGIEKSREVYEEACKHCSTDSQSIIRLLVGFARFEEQSREIERARAIIGIMIERIKDISLKDHDLQKEVDNYILAFEKRHGSRKSIEDIVSQKRLEHYESYLSESHNSQDYWTWFDYLILAEKHLDHNDCIEIYERAIGNEPPIANKASWTSYIYIWIFYAIYMELKIKDMKKTQEIYEECIKLMLSRNLMFSKIIVMFSKYLIRQDKLDIARKKLGFFIGKYPTMKLFREYISLEFELLQFDRCRKLYDKWILNFPNAAVVWIKYFEMENLLHETDRARAILNIAINYPDMNTPELIWKTFIDFEKDHSNYTRVAELYEQLLMQTDHIKVWLAYANFYVNMNGYQEKAREVFMRASQRYKELWDDAMNQRSSMTMPLMTPTSNSSSHLTSNFDPNSMPNMVMEDISRDRLKLLQSWLEFEEKLLSDDDKKCSTKIIGEIKSKMPEKIKKRRQLYNSDGSEAGWEEYYDFIFPDDRLAKPNIKLLSMAKKWKEQQNET